MENICTTQTKYCCWWFQFFQTIWSSVCVCICEYVPSTLFSTFAWTFHSLSIESFVNWHSHVMILWVLFLLNYKQMDCMTVYVLEPQHFTSTGWKWCKMHRDYTFRWYWYLYWIQAGIISLWNNCAFISRCDFCFG